MEHPMPDLVLMSTEYGGYISIVKLVTFLALFFLWLPLLNWVYNDAKSLETKEAYWTGIIFGAGAVTLIIWLIIPVFIIGMLLYIIAITAASLAYVKHHNSIVMDYDRLLTADHIKSLFVSEEKKLDDLKNVVFITANNNQVPLPEPKTPDFFGYKAACSVLNDAKRKRASSIIFSPTPQGYNITYYVDGAALKQPDLAQGQTEFFIRFVKNLADLDADERRKPQKGKFGIAQQTGKPDEWEVTTAGSTAGEQVKLKQIVKQSETRLSDISLMPEQYEQLNKLQGLKQGLFLITGPQKSGVTTTLYALLRNHDAFINSINTLEKQPSVKLPNITQNIYTLSDTGTTTFAKKLQEVIRMGPDIVGVADCDDAETARVACAGAKDGKTIYVALDANSVIQALGIWIKLVGDKKTAARTLLGISNQRLLRKLCTECRQAYTPDKELLRKFNIAPEKTKVLYRAGKVQYDKRGRESICENCQGTGYTGRTGVFETIILNDELRKVIIQSKSLSEIGSQFRRANMLYLQEQAMRKVIAGITDVNEMIRALSKPKR
jgi:type II secretory ATPase GspE/PulE/Tfp pilus assembly ATPase PilB-like protein